MSPANRGTPDEDEWSTHILVHNHRDARTCICHRRLDAAQSESGAPWGARRENEFLDDVDRQDFLKALAQTCQKTSFQVHVYCLMPNHIHLVVETPDANLVAGVAWLLSTYAIRRNHRRRVAAVGMDGGGLAEPAQEGTWQIGPGGAAAARNDQPLKWIAERVHLGTSKSANGKLHAWMMGRRQSAAESSIVSVETKQPIA